MTGRTTRKAAASVTSKVSSKTTKMQYNPKNSSQARSSSRPKSSKPRKCRPSKIATPRVSMRTSLTGPEGSSKNRAHIWMERIGNLRQRGRPCSLQLEKQNRKDRNSREEQPKQMKKWEELRDRWRCYRNSFNKNQEIFEFVCFISAKDMSAACKLLLIFYSTNLIATILFIYFRIKDELK